MRCFFLSHLGKFQAEDDFCWSHYLGDFFHRIFFWQSHKGGLVELLDFFLGLRDLFSSNSAI